MINSRRFLELLATRRRHPEEGDEIARLQAEAELAVLRLLRVVGPLDEAYLERERARVAAEVEEAKAGR